MLSVDAMVRGLLEQKTAKRKEYRKHHREAFERIWDDVASANGLTDNEVTFVPNMDGSLEGTILCNGTALAKIHVANDFYHVSGILMPGQTKTWGEHVRSTDQERFRLVLATFIADYMEMTDASIQAAE